MVTNNRKAGPLRPSSTSHVPHCHKKSSTIIRILFVALFMLFMLHNFHEQLGLQASYISTSDERFYYDESFSRTLPMSSAQQDYYDALVLFNKLTAVNAISHIDHCTVEIGWRQPENLVPSKIGTRCEPWWTREAIFLIEHVVRPNWNVLEWGAGSSTLWLSSHAGNITTIEDDGKWVGDLGNILSSHNITNVNLRHRDRQTNGTMNSLSRGCCYDNYILGASDIPDGSQDMVSVDGRARELCLKEAVRLVKPVGGVVVLDNSNRERYQGAIADFIPSGWLRHDAVIKNETEEQGYWVKRDDLLTTFWITR